MTASMQGRKRDVIVCQGLWTQRRRRQRAVFTAIDYTRGQSNRELANRLQMNGATVRLHLLELEAAGMVLAMSGYPTLWKRAS